MTVQRITSDFVERVGGDGFHDIKRAKNCACKLIWIVLFLAAWTMVCYQVFVYVRKYFSYPIDTKVELKFDETAAFPSVTFCNLNPVKHSAASEAFEGQMKEMIHQEFNGEGKENFKRGGWDDTKKNMDHLRPPDNFREEDYEDYEFLSGREEFMEDENIDTWTPDHQPEEIVWENSFFQKYFMVSDDMKCEVGHQMEDMLVECVWKGQQCFPENFTHFLHPVYGNCYAFNAGWEVESLLECKSKARKINKTIHTASMPGPSDGLSVMLFAEGEEYIPLLAGSIGVRVHVHSQEAPPQPLDTGFTVSGGFSTALEIRKVEITRLPLPYDSTDCKTNSGPYHQLIEGFWPRATYAMSACMQQCYQEMLRAKCKCVEADLFYFGDKLNLKPCNMNSTAQGRCVRQYESAFRRGNASVECRTNCSQACSETDFEVQVSSAQWPNHYYLEILKESAVVRNSKMQRFIEEADDHKLKENLLKVDVYYQSLNYKAIVEQASYEIVDMLADLGGAVDLWVGMSVLAVVQCIEYLLELLHYMCCRSQYKASSAQVSTINPRPIPTQQQVVQRKPLNSYSRKKPYDGVGQPYYEETRPPAVM